MATLPSPVCPSLISQLSRANACTDLLQNFSSVPAHPIAPVPQALREATLELASNNLVASVALTGVLVLQTGRWWAERADSEEQEAFEAEQTKDDVKEARHAKRKERAQEKSPKKRRAGAAAP